MTYELVDTEKANHPTTVLCRSLGISTSSFYGWRYRSANPSPRARSDAALTERIRKIHVQSRGTYGAPRVHAELRLGEGIRVGRKRVARLMRAAGIEGVYRRRRRGCTRRDPEAELAEDLVNRRFDVDGPNELWVSATSPSTRRPVARSTWPSCWTPGAAGSSGGRSPITSARSSSSTLCRWPSGDAARPKAGPSATPTP